MSAPETTVVAVPIDLAEMVGTLSQMYHQGKRNEVLESLALLVYDLSQEDHVKSTATDSDEDLDYRQSWDDIVSLQVYVDTDIYGTLDTSPPALPPFAPEETIVQHGEETEVYLQSWMDLAKEISTYPDDLFTRLWSTSELAQILSVSVDQLRRARRKNQLPLSIKNLIVDCVIYDGKRSRWFVRPA
ncbi:MAG: hypothetical protein HC919_01950 [Oscillatoriales cyanobacterium SM2_2_1]|nr:hypothetical protein [Oscillatoriales cyanobacterium SM2_2_1]